MISRNCRDFITTLRVLFCVFIAAECCYSGNSMSPGRGRPKIDDRREAHFGTGKVAMETRSRDRMNYEEKTQIVEECGKRHHDGVSTVDAFGTLTARRSSISASATKVPQFDDIVIGRNAGRGRWPWMALVFIKGDNGMEWECGGSLISSTHVLTAAHCVAGVSDDPDMVMVRLGEYSISTTLDGNHLDITVDAVILHPDNRAKEADIALLRLTKVVNLEEKLAVLCLPAADSSPAADSDVLVAGWGRRMFDDLDGTDVLQEANLQLVDADDCEQSYQNSRNFKQSFPNGFQNTVLCARGRQNQDACRGDSGGPLVQLIDERYYLVGVVSTGAGCGNPDYPGIYTKVAHYKNWITDNGGM